jgi:hypothetical protein
MSQVVLNSNSASLVQNQLTKNGAKVQSLAYSTNDSFPNLSQKASVVSPYVSFTGAPDSNSDTFNVPQSNLWFLGRLQFTATHALTADEINDYVGLNIIRNIDFVCNGQPFLSMTGEAFKAVVMSSEAQFQEFSYRYALPLDPASEDVVAGGVSSWISYVPLFGSWFTDAAKALNCSELAQLQVVITYKTRAESGLSAQISNLVAKLHTYKYLPASEAYNKIVVSNMQNSLMECFNTITERQQLITGTSIASAISFTSNIFYPVYKTHIFIAKNNTTGTDQALSLGCPYINIDTLSVDVGGENYFTNFKRSMINYPQAVGNMGNAISTSSTGVQRNSKQIMTINWGLLTDRKSNSGLASMANLNRPLYTITPNATAIPAGQDISDYWVFLVHEYWNILEVDPASKVLSVRANH